MSGFLRESLIRRRPYYLDRSIAESHVFEDVMQLVDLVREGLPTAALGFAAMFWLTSWSRVPARNSSARCS